MDKITLPEWVGDDWTSEDSQDSETMIILLTKKLNEIVEWINEQS